MEQETVDWAEFEGSVDGQYPEKFKFSHPGDAISGIVRDLRIATMPDGTRLPSLEIQDANGATWSVLAGPIGLQRALATHKPERSDTIAIVYTGDGEAKPGKSAPKLFEVVVKRGDTAAPVAAAPVAAAPAASSLI